MSKRRDSASAACDSAPVADLPSAPRVRAAVAAWLDRSLYRHPFEGRSAARYAVGARPAFGDLDERLLDAMGLRHGRLLELGSGPATFARRAAARHPALQVIAVEPSRTFARRHLGIHVLRGAGEALPLADGSIDVAVCLSSLRHVRDRGQTLRELRRVVAPGGRLVIVELDLAADAGRIAAHADGLASALLRRAFGPLVVRTAPPLATIAALAAAAGWRLAARRDDPVQPVYVLELG
jgi:SAM-dependent methyltransferase